MKIDIKQFVESLPAGCWHVLTCRVTYKVTDITYKQIREELSAHSSEPNHVIEFTDLFGGECALTVGAITEFFYWEPGHGELIDAYEKIHKKPEFGE